MRLFVVIVLGCLLALLGIRNAAVEHQGGVDWLLSVTIGCVFAMICFADARQMDKPLPSIAGLAILLLWPIAAPLYFLFSRGVRKGGLLALGVLAGVVAIYSISYCIASYVVWGDVVL